MTTDPFLIALNPQEDSRLPYLLRLPLDGGLVLKARDTWPRASRIYCHPFEESWPEEPDIVEQVDVSLCRRRGPAIDLVLARPRLSRSQFVFTEVKGRRAIFWQTQKAAKAANPGARVPQRRSGIEGFSIAVDTRERYGFRFSGRDVVIEKQALPAGDYGVKMDGRVIAAVERKTLENLVTSLSDGSLSFQMQRLAEVPLAAVVVEGRYSDLFKLRHTDAGWIAEVLSRLQVRYPEVAVIFADSRKFSEEWTYRFLASAFKDFEGGSADGLGENDEE